MNKVEKLDITLAKGLAIILVVVGHTLAGGVSNGNEWFQTFTDFIYLFHMPFFIFISGYVYFKPGRVERLCGEYFKHVKNQAVRLLIPFFFIGAAIVLGKIIMQNFLHVDNAPDDFWRGFLNLIWHTQESASVFLWYIFAIFVYGALVPLLYRFFKDKAVLWLLLGGGLFLLPPIHYFYLDKLTMFFIFFCLAGVVVKYERKYLSVIGSKKFFILFLVLFGASFFLFQYDVVDTKWNKLITGSLSIPVLHQICFHILKYKHRCVELFLSLGRHSYSVYLFNTICIGLTKGVIFLVMDWHGFNFYIVVPTLIAAGLIGPLLIEYIFLRRIAFIRQRILGFQ